jgi:uncharacterized protein (DUF1499 family)
MERDGADAREGAKAARTESLFRAVNEEIAGVTEDAPVDDARFVCECDDPECTEPMHIRLDAYEEVRDEPTRFIVKPGHVNENIERVVEETDGYEVVEKDAPGAAEVAEELDARP